MTKQECDRLIESYLAWLREGLSAEVTGRAVELTTPFLDRHNDHIQVYALRDEGKILLTDDGYIIADLEQSGLDISKSKKRRAILEATLNGFGVRMDGNQIVVEAAERSLGQRLHSLVQAMLAVNDMFVLSEPRVASLFWEDVRSFFDLHDVRYSPRVKIAGRSGYDHAIDFLIPSSRQRPERFVQTINAPSKNTISSYLFVLTDTREGRGSKSEAYAFLNDTEREVGGDVVEALEAYDVTPALWSRRDQYVSALAN